MQRLSFIKYSNITELLWEHRGLVGVKALSSSECKSWRGCCDRAEVRWSWTSLITNTFHLHCEHDTSWPAQRAHSDVAWKESSWFPDSAVLGSWEAESSYEREWEKITADTVLWGGLLQDAFRNTAKSRFKQSNYQQRSCGQMEQCILKSLRKMGLQCSEIE